MRGDRALESAKELGVVVNDRLANSKECEEVGELVVRRRLGCLANPLVLFA